MRSPKTCFFPRAPVRFTRSRVRNESVIQFSSISEYVYFIFCCHVYLLVKFLRVFNIVAARIATESTVDCRCHITWNGSRFLLNRNQVRGLCPSFAERRGKTSVVELAKGDRVLRTGTAAKHNLELRENNSKSVRSRLSEQGR